MYRALKAGVPVLRVQERSLSPTIEEDERRQDNA